MLDGITAILNILAPVLNRVLPDPVEQAKVQAELTKALVDNQSVIWQTSAQVMVADAQQDDKFTKRARPFLVYWSAGYVTLITVLAPFGIGGAIMSALKDVPSDLWMLMTVGVGAFGASRGFEKGLSMIGKKK